MEEFNKKSTCSCDSCEYFLRMYKGAGVGTCKKGTKKYRSEDSLCDFVENVDETELDTISSGYECYVCSEEILEKDFTKERSIGSFDSQGKIIHFYCPDCWTNVALEREKFRRQFDVP